MSYRYVNHLTALHQASLTKPFNTAFKIPFQDGWKDISYNQFWDDVQRVGVYWSATLVERGVKERDVVGLWMSGKAYIDVIHLFSLQRAGYTPHLMSAYLEDIDLVQSLFKQSGVRSIVCDTELVKGWERCEKDEIEITPMLTDKQISEISITEGTELEGLPLIDGDSEDILFIDQSSGSTSGRPKLIQKTRRWIDANAQKFQTGAWRTPVFIRTGSFCYAPQLNNSLRTFIYAECTVLTPTIIWSPEELSNIITTCGVTDIYLYPSLINDIIEKAKTSSLLLEKLKTLKTLGYGGGPIGEKTIEWAREAGIKIVVSRVSFPMFNGGHNNLFKCRFGSTEVGLIMISEPGGDPHILRFYHKLDYAFIPIQPETEDSKPLYELVVLPTSPDCPPPSMLSPIDGYYHTKDLFEPVGKEAYIFRGRTDDIIVMEDASNCNARYLEDRISSFCHDLTSKFVVLGQGRPSPALLVEPLEASAHVTTLHKTLSNRIDSLNSSETSLYPHERIKPEYIIILAKGSLPISERKGRVMRSKAEVMFKELLDKAYAGDSVWIVNNGWE